MPTKILLINEASFFKTGYSKYGRELLAELLKTNKYEIAELGTQACPWIQDHVEEVKKIPWKFYWNIPHKDSPEFEDFKRSGKLGEFGGFKFEDVCLDFQPDVVFSIRDHWFDTFIMNSPYRHIYKFAWMPTCDSQPQMPEWLSSAKSADAVFTYNDWSKEILESAGINVLDSCPPSCSEWFVPLNKESVRKELGIDPSLTIIGTVMRNQRRKLFSDLFQAFKQFLLKSQKTDTFLLAHTSYPDKGWDIPALLLEHGVSNKVFFSYVCPSCKHFYIDFYSDTVDICPNCKQYSAHLPNVKQGLNDQEMCKLFNCMDLYVQYANSEGFGISPVEAASCAVPCMEIDYSAMSDVVRKLDGIPIPVIHYVKEPETNVFRASPDNNAFVNLLINHTDKEYLKNRGLKAYNGYLKHYQWKLTAERWMQYFDSVPKANWQVQPRIINPSNDIPRCGNKDFARWLISDVLCEPEKIGTYLEARLIRDLMYGHTKGGLDGIYFNEDSILFQKSEYQQFGRKEAYNMMANLGNRRNQLEYKRGKHFGLL